MRRRELAYIESVEVHWLYLQAFQFFLTMIWEEVEIADIRVKDAGHFQIDLALAERSDSHLIMHLWSDWKTGLMSSMYAAKN